MLLTEAQLVAWGRLAGERAAPPLFVALRGPLGAGKSVLARAVARGAGVAGAMPSPTFNLLFRYAGRGGSTVVHLDLFRLEDAREIWELGWEELGREGEIVLVEWPERAGDHLPHDRWEVELAIPEGGEDRRALRLRRVGDPPPLPPLPGAAE